MDFMTADEKAQLQEKLSALVAKRPEISNRIAEARALGDLKENAEYHAAREDQAMMEAEIRRLEEKIAGAKVVDPSHAPDDVVFVGATVRLKDVETGEEDLFRLVGEATGNHMLDYVEVTVTSPMGESMMKARVGETIKVDAPRRVIRYEVMEIL
ncbi:MAG: transcription elongation factor GreA [Phycisphaeraceae bacterium]|nr:transcription elongation factor GreA [Phycisphaeraceae bacterium]